MELRQLRYLAVIAQETSFRKASRRLHVSQPPLSRQMKLLEEEIGSRLFERRGRGVALTKVGEYFAGEAARLVDEADRAVLTARSIAVAGSGVARLSCVGSLMYSFFPEMLAAFKRRCPGIRFEITELSTAGQARALAAGSVDLGFLRDWARADGICFEPLGEEAMEAIFPASRADVVADRGLAALADEPFIAGTAPLLREKMMECCATRGFSPRVEIECEQFTSVMKLVAAGIGWSIAPRFALSSISPEGIASLRLDQALVFGVAYREGRLPDPLPVIIDEARAFIGALQAR